MNNNAGTFIKKVSPQRETEQKLQDIHRDELTVSANRGAGLYLAVHLLFYLMPSAFDRQVDGENNTQVQCRWSPLDLRDPNSSDPSLFLLQMTGSPGYSGSSREEYLAYRMGKHRELSVLQRASSVLVIL